VQQIAIDEDVQITRLTVVGVVSRVLISAMYHITEPT
jgi:hypothetical protein